MKKLGIALGVFFGLILATILIVPLVVNVDKYRPQLIEAVNRQINGSLELSKLSLSLWGHIYVNAEGLKLKDSQGREVVGVKDAYFELPFLSVLSGSPDLTFKMNQPLISVVKDRSGKMNVLNLVKSSGTSQSTPSTPGTPPSTQGKPSTEGAPTIPGILARARLGLEIKNALVSYKDEVSGLNTQVKDLNFVMKNISLTHPIDMELWANLNTQLGKTFSVKGPARLVGHAQTDLKDGKIDHFNLTANLDLDSLEMSAPGLFEKRKGVATHADLAVSGSEKEVKIEKLSAQFFNAQINAQGSVTNLTSAAGAAASPVVNFNMKSNDIDFKPWVELIPMLKEYELGGSARIEADARGPSDKLGYQANLVFKGLTAKSPQLKAQPQIDGVVHVITDQVDNLLITMKAPGNHLKIQGKVVSFSKPQITAAVTSTGMDLDQMIHFPPPAEKGAAKTGTPAGGAPGKPASPASGPAADYDAMLAPLRENKILAGMVANLSVDMKMIQANRIRIDDLLCKMTFKDLAAGMDNCSLKIFAGLVKSNAHIQMKPKTPTYQFGASVTGMDLAKAVESQMPSMKNTVTGKLGFNMTGDGASFNPDPATSNLKAKGNAKIEQLNLTSVDMTKMIGEAVQKSLGQIAGKVPGLKNQSVPNLPGKGTKYELISSDFTIASGKFSAPNFVAKAAPNQGIDLKGTVTVGLKDFSLDTNWEVIDTYNLTKLKDISVEQAGVKVDHVFAEGNSPVKFPIHAGCTVMAPCYSYTQVPEYLAKVAMNNFTNGAKGKAKQEAQKQAETLIKKVAPPAVQEQLKNKLKGLFH